MSMPIKPPFNIHMESILAKYDQHSFKNGHEQLSDPNIFLIYTIVNPIDFEVSEVEKASCSDVDAIKAYVQHTYGEHSGQR